MKKLFVLLGLFFLPGLPLGASPHDFNRYFIDASEEVKPSVVNIVAYTKKKKRGKVLFVKNAYGTGTIISSNGFIITNYHLVRGSNFFHITDHLGNRYGTMKLKRGRRYLSDAKTDLAVLKIDGGGVKFKPVKIADSSLLVEGEWVIALGNPYGLRQSITAGIVSSKGRDNIGFSDIEDFIQTDVSINPGNSGGPLVNLYGEMVGINTAIRTVSGGFQGISFSIPSNMVKRIYNDLIRFSRVRRGWLGFIAAEKKFKHGGADSFVEIISVIKNSPAEMAGVWPGDIIKEVAGQPVKRLGSLISVIGKKKINTKIPMVLSRNGKIHRVFFILREKRDFYKIKRDVDFIFERYGIEVDVNSSGGGVVVTHISPNSSFYLLKRGDFILELNGKRITGLNDFFDFFRRYSRRNLVIKFLRESKEYEIEVID